MLTERARAYLLADLESAPEVLARLLADVSDSAAYDLRPDSARFTLREMVAHLADWESVFLTRLTQTREEEDAVLLGLDEGQIAISHDYAHADPQECLVRYAAGRAKILALLRSLAAPEWQRAGTHTELGLLTLEQQTILIAVHDGYHRLQTVTFVSPAAGK